MTDTPFVEKPRLAELETEDVGAAILDYHRAVASEVPVLYEKNQGPQTYHAASRRWTNARGTVLSLDEAREARLAPHACAIDEEDQASEATFDLDHVAELLAGEDPEPHTSRLNRALRWLWPLIGQMPYGWWTSGAVPSGAPAYAENRACPSRDSLRRRTVFCAGVCNLLLRAVGKRVPTYGNPLYDGGTYAYGCYFRGYSIPYALSKVLPGDLLLDFYQSSVHQGHVGVVLDGKVFLQSFDGNSYMEGGYNGPGMNKIYTVAQSVTAWNPDVIVRRQNWIDYKGDETHRAVA